MQNKEKLKAELKQANVVISQLKALVVNLERQLNEAKNLQPDQ